MRTCNRKNVAWTGRYTGLLILVMVFAVATELCQWDLGQKGELKKCESRSLQNYEGIDHFSLYRNVIFATVLVSSLILNLTLVASWIVIAVVGFPCFLILYARKADEAEEAKEKEE